MLNDDKYEVLIKALIKVSIEALIKVLTETSIKASIIM